MAASDAKPIPIKGQAYRITFPILDADGDLVSGAADLDSEISKDGGTFTDCTNEATEIATSSGMYYLDLTADEMNADTVAIIVKTSTSGAKTTPIVLYPAESTDIPVNVKSISDDTTAADNMESAFDGTGYGFTGCTIPTVTSLTNKTGFEIAGTKTRLDDLNDLAQSDILSDATPFAGSNVDAAISSRSSHSAADVWSYTARSLTDKAGFTISGTKTTLDDLNDLSAADVNAQVDAALADIALDHLIQVSAGSEKPTVGSYIDLMMNKDSNQTYDRSTDSMEALRDTEPHGTPMRGTDNAALASVCTEARLSELDDANIPSDIDAILEDTGTTLENHLTDIKGTGFVKDTHSLPQCLTATGFSTHSAEDVWNVTTRSLTDKEGFKISGTKHTLDDLNDISASDVNAEVSDVLKTDTISEMSQGAPPVNPTIEEALNYLYRKFRNKTETTSTEDAVYDDAGTTKLFKATLSDDGTTFTKGEYESGA